MATVRVTLDLDAVALSLAERAAELSGTSVSTVVSSTLARHLLSDYAPAPQPPDPDQDRRDAEADMELEAAAARADDEHRNRPDPGA